MTKPAPCIMINTWIYLGLMLILLVPITALPAEGYYTWVDDNGVTHYSEYKPNDYPAKRIDDTPVFGRKKLIAPDTPGPVVNPAKQAIDPDRLVAAERDRLQAKIMRIKQSNCALGKRNLATLLAYGRIRVSDEKGENRVLSEAEKAAKSEQARQIIRDNCAT